MVRSGETLAYARHIPSHSTRKTIAEHLIIFLLLCWVVWSLSNLVNAGRIDGNPREFGRLRIHATTTNEACKRHVQTHSVISMAERDNREKKKKKNPDNCRVKIPDHPVIFRFATIAKPIHSSSYFSETIRIRLSVFPTHFCLNLSKILPSFFLLLLHIQNSCQTLCGVVVCAEKQQKKSIEKHF